jgi:HemY protein
VTPVAALPSDRTAIDAATEALLVAPPMRPVLSPESEGEKETAKETASAPITPPPEAAPPVHAADPVAPPPIFRPRRVNEKHEVSAPAVIPLVRAPDDPGVPDDDILLNSETERGDQPGGWKGFLTRLVG